MDRIVFVFLVSYALAQTAAAQSQPSGVELNGNGVSKIFPPFDTAGWVMTRGIGIGTHAGDDYFALDWARDCQSQGQRLYAGISGSVQLNFANDGSMDGHGNTLVVADFKSGFALRYSHMSQFASGLKTGDLVLAGQFVGLVGNTGNVSASPECVSRGGNGSHAHIVLYKNAMQINGRPIRNASGAGGPTSFAAQFTFASPVRLIKGDRNPTVYALVDGLKYPVSAFVFANQGFDFDRNKAFFNPLAGNTFAQSSVDSQPDGGFFWPPRESALVKSEWDQTVYLIQDGRRKGLPYDAFFCRGFNFASVKTLPNDETLRFAPNQPAAAVGCSDELAQALADFPKILNLERRFGAANLGTYGYDYEWDPAWELRLLNFDFTNGRQATVFHITKVSNPSERYMIFWDPDFFEWKGWYRIQ